jgi:hypothetical protein
VHAAYGGLLGTKLSAVNQSHKMEIFSVENTAYINQELMVYIHTQKKSYTCSSRE